MLSHTSSAACEIRQSSGLWKIGLALEDAHSPLHKATLVLESSENLLGLYSIEDRNPRNNAG